jgi:hypothetical protein
LPVWVWFIKLIGNIKDLLNPLFDQHPVFL